MAERKYLDFTGLGQYDAKIKAHLAAADEATLAAAKKYADDLGVSYDVAGSAATAESNAKGYTDGKVTELNGTIAGVKTIAEQGVADAATAKSAADKAQGEVDALETLVGVLPQGTSATSVVDYVNVKTAGIATDAALGELQGQLSVAQGEISAIKGDYLKAADKQALEGQISAAQSAASDDAVDRVLGYLAEEEVNADFDTLKEVAAWIESDTTRAAQLTTRVSTAEGKISTLEGEMDTAQADILALQQAIGSEGSVDSMIDAAVEAEAALRIAADEALDAKISANATAAANAKSAADTAQGEVDALEGEVGELAGVVATKAAQSDLEGVAGRVTTAEGKITTLEGASHSHDNKTVLDGITAGLVADWNDAVAKEHEHANKDVLDGITATLVSNWNAAEGNAKAYADGLVAEFVAITSAEIDGLFA